MADNIENDDLDDEDVIEIVLTEDGKSNVNSKPNPKEGAEDEEITPEKDPDEEEEVEEDDEELDSKQKMGRRAEKRIKKLLAEKKERDQVISNLSSELEKTQGVNTEMQTQWRDAMERSVTEQETRLDAQESMARKAVESAKVSGDIQAETDAMTILTDVRVDKRTVESQKRALEQSKTTKVEPEEPPQTQPRQSRPDPDAKKWHKRNSWFGGQAPKDRAMTQTAYYVHSDLIGEGFNPAEEPDEYYAELDMRLREEFPDEFKSSTKKKTSPVTHGRTKAGSSSGGKTRKVTLTRAQQDRATALGVSLEDYAREVSKIQERQ